MDKQWFVKGWVGYVFLSNLVASIVTFLLLLPELLKISLILIARCSAEMFTYSWPVLVANLSFIVNENFDKLLLRQVTACKHIACTRWVFMAPAPKYPCSSALFIQAFRLGAEPFFFSHAKNKNAGQTYARIMDYFVITVCVIFVALVANIEILKYFISTMQPSSYWVGLGCRAAAGFWLCEPGYLYELIGMV